jgi:hypothetical protein
MSGEDPMYELTVDQPNSPKGTPIQIVGLGTYKNGGTYSVSKDEADRFRSHHTRQESVYAEDGSVVGSKTSSGPTLLQASTNMLGVTVETVSSSSPAPAGDANKAKDTKGGDSK